MTDRYSYTHDVIDQDSGAIIVPDFDCELDLDVTFAGGELTIEVVGVFVGDVDIMASKSPTVRAIACDIADAADRDTWLVEKVMEYEGIVYRGKDYNDPDGLLVRMEQ